MGPGRFAIRRVYHLTLQYESPPTSEARPPIQTIHPQATGWTMMVGVLVCKMTAFLTGTAVLAIYRSPFAILWFMPLIIRLLAIKFSLRRTPLMIGSQDGVAADSVEPCVFQLDGYSEGFVLIQAPKALGTQFFHHYGHPQRSQVPQDRWNERVSMTLVAVMGLYFPVSWLAFVFAPNALRLIWLSYQLYMLVVSMVHKYASLTRMGSLEESIGKSIPGFSSAFEIPHCEL